MVISLTPSNDKLMDFGDDSAQFQCKGIKTPPSELCESNSGVSLEKTGGPIE